MSRRGLPTSVTMELSNLMYVSRVASINNSISAKLTKLKTKLVTLERLLATILKKVSLTSHSVIEQVYDGFFGFRGLT